MRQRFSKIIFLIVLSICSYADEDLEITAKINNDFSSKYIAFINFEFKNNTQDWIVLSKQNISFSPKADNNIEVLNGQKLLVWSEFAKEKEQELKASSKLWATFWFGGIGTMYSSATILDEKDNLSQTLKNNNQTYPNGHLYKNDILIPPALSVKRYFIVSSKNHKEYGYLNKLSFQYEQNNKQIKRDLIFRDTQYNENGQKDILGQLSKNHYVWQNDL
jgi:hypothetical protein